MSRGGNAPAAIPRAGDPPATLPRSGLARAASLRLAGAVVVAAALSGCAGPQRPPGAAPPPEPERTYATPAEESEPAMEQQGAPPAGAEGAALPSPASRQRAPGVSSMRDERLATEEDASADANELRDLSARLDAKLRMAAPACSELQSLRDRICSLAERICSLADSGDDRDADLAAQCRDGRKRCDRARRQVGAMCR